MFGKIKKEKNDIDPEKFVSVKTDGTILNFNKFKISLDLASGIYRNKKLLKDTENEQKEIKILLNKLRKYNPTKLKNLNVKEETLSSAEKLLNNRHEVIDAFKTGIFPYIDGLQIKEEEEEEDDTKKFIKYIENETKGINYNLFEHYFNFVVPSTLAKYLNETKNKNKNNELVEEIKKRWSNLKDEAEKMSEDEKETEKPDKLLKIVKENQKQGGLGIKILTPNQMLSRLPTTLPQLNAGANSEKLKNEIRQLLYSLYRSKRLTKNVYKSLVGVIRV